MADLTPVWLITACTSGFGEAIALNALRRGHHVVATARDASRLTALHAAGATVLDLDVTAADAALASAFAAAAAAHGGRLTHVVNCAGYLLEGAVEECSQAEVAATFAANVFGAANVTRAAAPHLRAAAARGERPTLAHFGSTASWSGGPAVGLYCATKWAVSGLTESVAAELAGFGIRAVIIEPGYFRTGFLQTGDGAGAGSVHRIQSARTLDVYEDTVVGQWRAILSATDGKQLGDVEKGARVVVDVLTSSGSAEGREVPLRLMLGSDAIEAVRTKLRDTEKLLKEWEEISRSTDY